MRRTVLALSISLLLLSASAAPARAALKGDYLEARSADVYTGPCFANSEVGLTGHEAILAWKIQTGAWKGVDLSGLSIVAVVRASATLGDPYHTAYPARSVLIVDSRATSQQRTALAAFAGSMAGDLLQHVVRVESAPIQMTVRLSVARQETAQWKNFDYLLISDTIREDLRRMLAIVEAEKMHSARAQAPEF